jgi:hypothetical protein
MSIEQKINVIIDNKPYPIPIEMRPLWRVCLILICIAVVSGDKRYLSSKKINILVWMLIRKNKWPDYGDYLTDRVIDSPMISVDTATFRGIEFAKAKGFLYFDSEKIYITDSGYDLYLILLENDIMRDEIHFLEEYGNKVTDRKIKNLTNKGK